MRLQIAVLLCFTVVSIAARSLEKPFKLSRTHLLYGQSYYGLAPGESALTPNYFTQKVDHFDTSNSKTFNQRYYLNEQWYKPGGPSFLFVGGESEANPSLIQNEALPWIVIAKQANARVFLLEHRFYGASQPTGDLEVASLKFLTSQQALADINDFILGINANLSLTSPLWITFGGSYAGALSAWARMKYPDTVFAAVASSATVKAVVDFSQSLDVVYTALHAYNPKCADSLSSGFGKMNELIKTPAGRDELTANFSLCSNLENDDSDIINYFYGAMISNYMTTVQYSHVNIPSYNDTLTIENLCANQLKGDVNGYGGIISVTDWLLKYYGETCVDINFDSYISYIKAGTAGTFGGNFKAWFWQSCNEFGDFKSTNSNATNSIFTRPDVPVDYFIKQCITIFGDVFSNATVYANIDKTNAYYAGQSFNASRVISSNGSNDPWHVLSILTANNVELYPIVVAGAGHLADTYPPGGNDPVALDTVRGKIRNHVLQWTSAGG